MNIDTLIEAAKEIAKKHPDNLAFKDFVDQIETIKELEHLMSAVARNTVKEMDNKNKAIDYDKMIDQYKKWYQYEKKIAIEAQKDYMDKMIKNSYDSEFNKKW